MTDRVAVAVLASGSGTNLQALLDAAADPTYPARIAVVLTDRPGAPALERARAAGVATVVVRRRDHPDRDAFDTATAEALEGFGVRWVCLAGYMRIVGEGLLSRFPGRVLNIHPSLLPAFPGLHAQQQAFDHGVMVTGCTVHFVDSGMDTGPIVAQTAVPVLPGDDADTLRRRILAAEHRTYPAVLRLAVEDRLEVVGRRVRIKERT